MSQSSTTNKVGYDGNGSTTAFAFSHPLNATADLEVIVITESTGAESVRAEGTGATEYSIVLADDKSSATVTFVTAPLSTEAVLLNRKTALTQASTYDLHNNIESDLDKSIQSDLSIQEQVDRCVKVPKADGIAHDGNSDTVFDAELPTVIGATAGDSLRLNSGKTALEWGVVEGNVDGPASSTDNAIARFNGTAGDTLQDSGILIDDSNNMTNLTATSPVLNTGVSGTAVLDEDNMASNSATQIATQQSIKAYVDSQVGGAGDVTAGANITDNRIVRGDGGVKGVQESGIVIDDSNNVSSMGTLGCGAISSTGAIASDIGAYAQTPDVNADNLSVQESSSQVGMSIIGTTGGNCNLFFGDSASASQGRIIYENSGDTMNFRTAGVERFHINSTEAKFVVETLHDGASIGHTVQTGTGDGTTTIDWGAGNLYKHTFGAQNETFTFTAPTNPGTFILILVQDSVGSRTATWPASVDWPAGTAPTLTTTATTGTDIIHFVYDGTNYYGTSAADFS
jgi:hypothetical protein